MKTQLSKSLIRFLTVSIFSLLLCTNVARADWLSDGEVALGFEAGNFGGGFSAKFPHSADTAWQILLGLGSANSIGGRYISHFNEWRQSRVYWFGGASIWFWSGNAFYDSETAFGVSAGIGLDYNLSRIADIPIPLSLNVYAGPSYAAFSSYKGLDLLGFGLGLHYRF